MFICSTQYDPALDVQFTPVQGAHFYWNLHIATELKKSDNYASRYYDMERLDKTYPNSCYKGLLFSAMTFCIH